MKVLNDYGDIPPWYSGPVFWRPRSRSRRGIGAVLLATVLALIGCAGCQHNPPPPPTTPTNITDAEPPPPYSPPDGPATCLDVCRNGQHLRCSWANDTPAGATCVDVCANYQDGPAPWDLDCRARKTNCAAIDGCQ